MNSKQAGAAHGSIYYNPHNGKHNKGVKKKC